VDGFGEAAGTSGAATEFAQDAPGLELGVGAVGVFLGLRLASAFVRGDHVFAGVVVAVVALVAQGDQVGLTQRGEDVQIRAAAVSCVLPGNCPDTHRIVPSGEAITCRFIPCIVCLPE
jgi:hypothetical protein